MENANLEEPRPTQVGPQTSPSNPQRSRFPSIRAILLLGILGLLVVGAASAFGGYNSGIALRTAAQKTQVAGSAKEQFDLAIEDLATGRYTRARQRFEYVISLDPGYPGVTEGLAEALIHINTTATATVAPTPTVTPTPDTRAIEDRYAQAQQNVASQEWDKAIETLLAVRKSDPNFNPVEIDGMLYVSLIHRGKQKILNADLEGGIYDLSLASRFGPLDTESQSLLDWSRMYITGASFWELDWKQAVQYFEQVGPAMPGLRDGSGMSASERYRQALIGYGNQLMDEEDWCTAQTMFEQSLAIGPDPNGQAEQAYQEAVNNCGGISDEDEQDTDENSDTPPEEEPTPDGGGGEPSPYPEPTAAP